MVNLTSQVLASTYPAARWGIRLFIRTGDVSFCIGERLTNVEPRVSRPIKGNFQIVRYITTAAPSDSVWSVH